MNLFSYLFAPRGAETERERAVSKQLHQDIAIDPLLDQLTALPDPDQVLENAGLSRVDLRKMEYDDEIYTALETRQAAVLRMPWRLEPGEGEAVEFVWRELEPILHPLLSGAWQAVPYGYSVVEAVYGHRDGGLIGIDRVEERPFEWFEPRPTGELRYYPPDGAMHLDVDADKKFFLTRRSATYTNPYGEALLSRLYAAFVLRQSGWRFWPQFLERFGAPLLVGKTAGSVADMANALAQAVQSAVVAVDKDDDVDHVSSSGDGKAFEQFDMAISRRIQKVILGQTLTTDVSGTGSYAAASVHNTVRSDRRDADLRLVTITVNRVIKALTLLNWPDTPSDEIPQFVFVDESGLQKERAERDAILTQAGIVTLNHDYIARAYDYEEGEFEIPEPVEPAAAFPMAAHPPSLKLAAEPPELTPEQQALEDLADKSLAKTPQPIDPDAIAAAVRSAKSPEDLEQRLAQVMRGADLDSFRQTLEQSLFAADIMGYVNGE